jgi:hypothetical protein
MATKINISIPQPCHENWQEMTVVDKGRFCNSCQKKVFDFTSSSDREIINAFEKNNKLCGRFLGSQLNRDLVKPKEKSSLWLAVTTALISLIGLNEVKAQKTTKTEQTDKKVLNDTDGNQCIEIEFSGVVSDNVGPLPGANIAIKGTSIKGMAIHTSTDIDGNFKIKCKTGDTLVISFVGYEDKVLVVENSNKMKIVLEGIESEIIYAGSPDAQFYKRLHKVPCTKKHTFFGRIFHNLGYWFR